MSDLSELSKPLYYDYQFRPNMTTTEQIELFEYIYNFIICEIRAIPQFHSRSDGYKCFLMKWSEEYRYVFNLPENFISLYDFSECQRLARSGDKFQIDIFEKCWYHCCCNPIFFPKTSMKTNVNNQQYMGTVSLIMEPPKLL